MIKTTTRISDDIRFRLIGVLPISMFIARAIQYIQLGEPGWIIASCHISNLMLGVGMIFRTPLLIRVGAIWLVIGLPMWAIDAVLSWVLWWSSIYSHVGGFLIALYAISKTRATGKSWLLALVWFVFLQLVTRYTTTPKTLEMNPNVAHFTYPLVEGWFSSYWEFWPVCLIFIAVMVWGVEVTLRMFYPLEGASRVSRRSANAGRKFSTEA
jgi:hypothetical protein